MAELFDILTFDESKVIDVLNIGVAYQQVALLITPIRPAGMYMLGFSLTYGFDRVTESVFMRWRQNGGAWNEYQREPKDITDSLTAYYQFPAIYPKGSQTIELQMRKETVNGTLNLEYGDVFFQRIGNA